MITLLVAAAVGLVFSLLATPLFVRLFKKLQWGQFIRVDGPETHYSKRGTPTMGGVVFILGSIIGYLVAHSVYSDVAWTKMGLLVLGMMVGLGCVGFVDDFLKIRQQGSLGLSEWAKILGQVVVGTVFAILAISFPDSTGLTPASLAISAVRDIPWLNLAVFVPPVAIVLFVIWVNLITVSASNGVNLTDGADGLATGAAIFSLLAYVVIGFWQSNQNCLAPHLDPEVAYKCYDVRAPLDLAVVAAAIAGSLVGFLWWNTHPAQMFMGDTGSLALGGAIAALAVLSRTELLLVLTGGLFVVITVSLLLQRNWFKLTRWRTGTGQRMFLMSPLHNHFAVKGWAEITIVVRFWIIQALCVAAGVGLFYLEWVLR